MSVQRLRQLQSRLKKDKALFRDYDHIIREQEREGIVEQTIINENDGYFLPHHGVSRQDKEATKLRIVFDGSAKPSEDDLSLNECLEKGPNSVPSLFDIILRFREHPIGLTADIEKAFHQIQIDPEDRKMIKFLWFDDIDKENPEIKHYQFRRLRFGLKPSPAILAGTVEQHLSTQNETDPDIVELRPSSLYVDDFAGGAHNDSQAFEVYKSSREIMNSGGFTLRKWNSNSREVRERIAKEQTATASNFGSVDTSNDPVITENAVLSPSTPPKSKEFSQGKILGLNWDVHIDELKCDTTELIAYAKSLPITKRSVLNISAKIFDPLGLLSPFTIKILCSRYFAIEASTGIPHYPVSI